MGNGKGLHGTKDPLKDAKVSMGNGQWAKSQVFHGQWAKKQKGLCTKVSMGKGRKLKVKMHPRFPWAIGKG
jgi:hypothetical protein